MSEKRVPAGVPNGGQFAASAKDEVDVDLGSTGPANPEERLATFVTAMDGIEARWAYHSGNMQPHAIASDCEKCARDGVHRQVRAILNDPSETSAAVRLDQVAAKVEELRAENDGDYHSGTMQPHQSASDCRKCGRRGALDDVSEALAS